MEDKINVTICLGSSCFSRKNRDVVSVLQEYITDKNLKTKITLKGGHCFGHCKKGPIMLVNGQEFIEINPSKAIAIIESFLMEE
ncbi:MAG: (2Fe-2S) ferredoxin domain-containing protein [Bacteroidales bacterium]|jgi:NADH:ubiquinone oxidoreductase subunit E|nr:(2Fe-2S) ferredoxin domain-containing protein [Bacteroidales bacterium]